MTLEQCDEKFEDKLAGGLKNEMRNLANFQQNTRKSQNLDFYWVLFYRVENYMSLKLTGVFCVMTMM